jgi:hypothetical protein
VTVLVSIISVAESPGYPAIDLSGRLSVGAVWFYFRPLGLRAVLADLALAVVDLEAAALGILA